MKEPGNSTTICNTVSEGKTFWLPHFLISPLIKKCASGMQTLPRKVMVTAAHLSRERWLVSVLFQVQNKWVLGTRSKKPPCKSCAEQAGDPATRGVPGNTPAFGWTDLEGYLLQHSPLSVALIYPPHSFWKSPSSLNPEKQWEYPFPVSRENITSSIKPYGFKSCSKLESTL